MSKLELKIPPVLATLLFGLLMWLVSVLLPEITMPCIFRWTAFITLMIAGAFFSVSGVASFRKARTTVNPTTPDACSSLVIAGIYKKSRNPMYVGFLLFLIGWGLLLGSLYALLLCVVFILYMNRFQIKAEEQALESLFGKDFLSYKNRVRKWL